MQEQALAFAQCMREHGIDMPDPQFGNDGNGATVGIGDGERRPRATPTSRRRRRPARRSTGWSAAATGSTAAGVGRHRRPTAAAT